MQLDTLIFDMDGVLIDVSESYRTATRLTVQFYFERLLGLAPDAGELVAREEVSALKLAGGFNNDWDLTAALVRYYLALIPPQSPVALPTDQRQIVDYLQRAGAQISATVTDLARRKDIAAFAQNVAVNGGGLTTVQKILGEKNDHLLFASGDLRETNLTKRIFEEFYLDEELFQQAYGEARQFIHEPGLIHRERLIPTLQSLISLSHRTALGIATGRPRDQALFALQTMGIADLFRAVIALEDVMAAEEKQFADHATRVNLSKPHPFMLLECARKIGGTRLAYVGDTLDDIRAANAAKRERNFVSIGCLAAAEDKTYLRREFERVGADVVIEQPDELVGLIETRPGRF